MTMATSKRDLFEERLNCFQHQMQHARTDIMSLVRKLFEKGFTNVQNNLKVIAFRGWNPFTMALLLDPLIRATMTEEMIEWERSSGLFPAWAIKSKSEMCYSEQSDETVTFKSAKIHDKDLNRLNVEKGALAQYVADTILCKVNQQKSREQVQKRKLEGDTKRNRILKIQKKLTTRKLVLDGRSYHLDHNVLQHVKRRRKQLETIKFEKQQKDELEYMKSCFKADRVLQKYGTDYVSKGKRKDDIVTYLKPLKRDGDNAIPKSHKAVEERYLNWKMHELKEIAITNNDDLMKEFELWKLGFTNNDTRNEEQVEKNT